MMSAVQELKDAQAVRQVQLQNSFTDAGLGKFAQGVAARIVVLEVWLQRDAAASGHYNVEKWDTDVKQLVAPIKE